MAIAALKELLARGLIQNDSRLPPRTSRSLRARLRCRKPAAPGWKNHVRYKTPRVHLAARQCGNGVAARGARAAGRYARHRFAMARRRAPRISPDGIVSAGIARIGFGRRPERRARAALRATRSATASRARRRAGAFESGC